MKAWESRIQQLQREIIASYEADIASSLGLLATLDAEVAQVRRRGEFYLAMQARLLGDETAMIEWRVFLTLLRLSGTSG